MKVLRRRWTAGLGALGAMLALMLVATPAFAQGDPVGADTLALDPNAAVNFVWVLVTGFLVFFMQPGFALLGAGLVRTKNTVNYLTKSFMDFCMGALGYWTIGFALMFGGSGAVIASTAAKGLETGNKFFGTSGFFLAGASNDVTTAAVWWFQMVFAATAATIVAGIVAERMKVTAYLAYSFIVTAIIYAIYGHWVWGGGWLWTLPFGAGARDFAGSGVVHTVGGVVGLAGAWLLGARLGKFNADGTPNPIRGHNIPYVVIGTFILFFGWFGFNPGSTLAATDLRISIIAVNTFLAGCAGAVVGLYWSLAKTGRADIVMACNGALAGLVGITAPCAYVDPWAAVVIGAVAPLVMIATNNFVERVLRVDDVVGAVGVHAGGGLWGLLSIGIFATGAYGGVAGIIAGDYEQIIAQLISMVTVVVWSFVAGVILFAAIKFTIGLRATPEEERQGLDVPEHGTEAYPAEAAR